MTYRDGEAPDHSTESLLRLVGRARSAARAGGWKHVARSAAHEVRLHLKNAAGMAYSRIFRTGAVFEFRGEQYEYFFHRYNMTWRNERAVEVPIFRRLVERAQGPVLEVGNVLSHYLPVRHEILDRYERAPGVINEDAESFDPVKSYALIISVSTIEHIGFDEEPPDPPKVRRVVERLRSLLAVGGRLVASFPVGCNPYIDGELRRGTFPLAQYRCLARVGGPSIWREVPFDPMAVRPSLRRTETLVVASADRSG